MSTAPFAYTAVDDIAKEERALNRGAGGEGSVERCIDCGQANALLFGTYVRVPTGGLCRGVRVPTV